MHFTSQCKGRYCTSNYDQIVVTLSKNEWNRATTPAHYILSFSTTVFKKPCHMRRAAMICLLVPQIMPQYSKIKLTQTPCFLAPNLI